MGPLPGGGGGGGTLQNSSTVSAGFSALLASQYPTTPVYDSNGLYYSDGQPAVYDRWVSINEYNQDPGIIVMPVTDPDSANVAIQTSSPTCTWTRRWSASRIGTPPTIPPKDVSDPNWVFVGGTPAALNQRVGSDNASVIFEAQGVYQYEALDPTQVVITADTPPFLQGVVYSLATWLDNYVSSGTGDVGKTGGGNPVLIG